MTCPLETGSIHLGGRRSTSVTKLYVLHSPSRERNLNRMAPCASFRPSVSAAASLTTVGKRITGDRCPGGHTSNAVVCHQRVPGITFGER